VDCVTVDDRQAARLATAFLLGLGHRKIGFVVGDGDILFYRERAAGYREALEDAGLTYDEQLVCWGGPWFDHGLKRIKRLVNAGMTAVAGASDCLVDGALEVLRGLGKRIPEDVSAVGLGGSPAPPESFLTTVGVDWFEMGKQAGTCLLARIDGDREPGRRIRVPGRLVQRRSSAEADEKRGSEAPPRE
jgi:LacI family transcriptional regulator